jgi:hypothetical protein
MTTTSDQTVRPLFYDGEYLGADDLQAAVSYGRAGQARHALGAHLFGIAVGFELVERPLTGDDVEMVLTPGLAWDGYGRALVAPAPQRLSVDDLAQFTDDTAPEGVPIELWIAYRELTGGPPAAGFACPDDELNGRVIETYRLEARRAATTDPHSVTLANRTLPAKNAVSTFDPTRGPLYDEAVAAQTFPDSDRARWPLFVGLVRWRKDPGQPGRYVKRSDDDRNAARRGRRYVGAVAETIVAPDGVLRLRDRWKDPDDPVLQFQPPIVAPASGSFVNDLVWCEGHLRVVGDTRLQAGKLDFRVAGGGDAGVPVYLRRTTATTPSPTTTLDAFIGPPVTVVGQKPTTRFTVSSTDGSGMPKECLTVVTDGSVGINAASPSNTLQIEGPSGVRYRYAYFTGEGPSAALAFNAYSGTAGWTSPDTAHRAAAIVLNDAGFTLQTSPNGATPAWTVHAVVQGDTGNVGIGTTAPAAKLHLTSPALGPKPDQGNLMLLSSSADFEYDGGTDKLFVFKDTGGTTAFMGGKIGMGTVTPEDPLHVKAAGSIRLTIDGANNGYAGVRVRTNQREYFSGINTNTNRWCIFDNDAATERFTVLPSGNVGINNTNPAYRLDVSGDLHVTGSASKPGIYWTNVSDARLKKNIEDIAKPLDKLLGLHGVTFAWRDPKQIGAHAGRHYGFIAQEVERVFPDWVETQPTGELAINPSGLEALLVESVRELADRCSRLEAELSTLKKRLAKKV